MIDEKQYCRSASVVRWSSSPIFGRWASSSARMEASGDRSTPSFSNDRFYRIAKQVEFGSIPMSRATHKCVRMRAPNEFMTNSLRHFFFAELVFARWQQMQSNLGPIRGVETLWQGDQLSPGPSSDYSLPFILRILHITRLLKFAITA